MQSREPSTRSEAGSEKGEMTYMLIDALGNGRFVPNLQFELGWEDQLPVALCVCLRLDGCTSSEGVFYSTELAGPDGLYVTLIAEPQTTPAAIPDAKRILRQQRDVVRFDVVHIRQLV